MSSSGKSIGAFEAKTRLAELLKRVENGERITITRRGVPIAEIVPPAKKHDKRAIREAVKALRQFRKGRKLGAGLSLRKMIAEGRRF